MRSLAFLMAFLGFTAFSQNCSHLWQHDLATGTYGPKGYMGDTHAAYGIFSFLNDSKRYFVVKGSFPDARFFSVETYNGSKNGSGKSLFDSEIKPDPGSLNPFVEGVNLKASPRNYTVVIAPEGAPQLGQNQIPFEPRERHVSFYIRYYAPNGGATVTLADLPQIEAFDLKTGKPAPCGKPWPVENFTRYPQFLGILSHRPDGVFPFELAKWHKGSNSAVGKYAEGHSEMRFDEVAVVRFKAPTFFHSSSEEVFHKRDQVRYWSLCAINFPNNQGLICLADHNTPADSNGFVTAVMGTGDKVKAEALKRGYYFIPDIRPLNSKMILFAFRNILPNQEFKENHQYRGDYNPQARICRDTSFLAGNCEWW